MKKPCPKTLAQVRAEVLWIEQRTAGKQTAQKELISDCSL
jgi:hypothetical protein